MEVSVTLTNLAVKPTIDVDNFVVVKADIGSERVVADVSREAINDYFNQYILDDEERIGLVESNIEALSMIIQEKYGRREIHSGYLGGSAVTCIIVELSDMRAGPRLDDGRVLISRGAGYRQRICP